MTGSTPAASRRAADRRSRRRRINARGDYRATLATYLDELPAAPGSGNLLLADAEARVLRGLFEEDANILARALAERLNRFWSFTSGCALLSGRRPLL